MSSFIFPNPSRTPEHQFLRRYFTPPTHETRQVRRVTGERLMSRRVDGDSVHRFRIRRLVGARLLRLLLDRPALEDSVGQFGDEARRLEDDVDAVAVAREHRVHERDLVLGTGDRDVEEAPLLLETLGGRGGAIARKPALRQAHYDHVAPLEPLR